MRILIEGEVRQLTNRPINNNTLTIELHSPNYIVGLPSFQANTPLELITAASDATFLKIDTKDWLKILDEFPNVSNQLNKRIYLIEILVILIIFWPRWPLSLARRARGRWPVGPRPNRPNIIYYIYIYIYIHTYIHSFIHTFIH